MPQLDVAKAIQVVKRDTEAKDKESIESSSSDDDSSDSDKESASESKDSTSSSTHKAELEAKLNEALAEVKRLQKQISQV